MASAFSRRSSDFSDPPVKECSGTTSWANQHQMSRGLEPSPSISSENLIAVDEATHWMISGYYSSKQLFSKGKTVREWLSHQSLDEQREFGLQVLREFGVIK